ncbi:MAG: PRC-barrel domain-containing protein, partial [Methylophilaceae bacterium]
HSSARRTKMNQAQVFINAPLKASDMIDTDVVSPQGDSLGEVREVVIDPNTGRVAYAVVSFGGFLSVGEKLFAIPFKALKYNWDENEYVLDVSKEQLEEAPGFDEDNWPTMSEQWNRDVHKYYELPPYWE